MLDTRPENLLRRYQNGLSLAEIAAVTRIPTSTLSRRLRTHSDDYRVARQWRPKRRDAALLYIKGRSTTAIAKELGVTHQTVSYWLRSMHTEYTTLFRRGVFASTADVLTDFSKSVSQRRPVEEWLIQNLPVLLQSEASTHAATMSTRRERSLCLSECGRSADYRDSPYLAS